MESDDVDERREALEAVLFVGGDGFVKDVDDAVAQAPSQDGVKSSWWASAASLGMDMIPVVGEAKALWQVWSGRDLLTGEEVNRLESAVALIPFAKVFKGGKAMWACLRKGSKVGLAPTKAELVAVIRSMRPKAHWTPAQCKAFGDKQLRLVKAAERGEARVIKVTDEMRREAKRAKRQYRKMQKQLHPDKAAEHKAMHVDHVQDMQLNGRAGDFKNFQFLDPHVNTSMGAQLQGKLGKLSNKAAETVAGSVQDPKVAQALREKGLKGCQEELKRKAAGGAVLTELEQQLAKTGTLLDPSNELLRALNPSETQKIQAIQYLAVAAIERETLKKLAQASQDNRNQLNMELAKEKRQILESAEKGRIEKKLEEGARLLDQVKELNRRQALEAALEKQRQELEDAMYLKRVNLERVEREQALIQRVEAQMKRDKAARELQLK